MFELQSFSVFGVKANAEAKDPILAFGFLFAIGVLAAIYFLQNHDLGVVARRLTQAKIDNNIRELKFELNRTIRAINASIHQIREGITQGDIAALRLQRREAVREIERLVALDQLIGAKIRGSKRLPLALVVIGLSAQALVGYLGVTEAIDGSSGPKSHMFEIGFQFQVEWPR